MNTKPRSPKREDILRAVGNALPNASRATALAIYEMLKGYGVAPVITVKAQAGTAVIAKMLKTGALKIHRANAETVTATYVVGDGPERERVGMNLTKVTRRLRETGFPTCYAASPTMDDGTRVVVPYHGPVA